METQRAAHRGAVRFDAEWGAEVQATDGTRLAGTIRDLSQEGAFVATEDHTGFEPDSAIELTLTSSTGLTLRALGTVRWVGHSAQHECSGIGLRLDRPPEELSAWYRARTRRWLIRTAFEKAWPSGETPQTQTNVVI